MTASIDGRELSGYCSGTQQEGSPAILLDSGMGGGQHQLSDLEERFAERTLVCAYDRPGSVQATRRPRTPRPVSELVADLDAFATAADARPPYLLVGYSMGANVAFMYTQAHPEKVAGFVAMNPVPPEETLLPARSRRRPSSRRSCRLTAAENDENTSFHEPMLEQPAPGAGMPYSVMFDEDCGGDSDFCSRILGAADPDHEVTDRSRRRRSVCTRQGRRARHLLGRPRAVRETINVVMNGTK